jgi:hypothetical protein
MVHTLANDLFIRVAGLGKGPVPRWNRPFFIMNLDHLRWQITSAWNWAANHPVTMILFLPAGLIALGILIARAGRAFQNRQRELRRQKRIERHLRRLTRPAP